MFPGKEFKIGEKTYTVPALSLGQLRGGLIDKLKQHDEMAKQDDNGGYEIVMLRAELIYEAVKRNYTDLTLEDFLNQLDLSQTNGLWLAVLGLSGFTPGEAKAAETKPETGPTDGTSGLSTAA